MKVAQVHGVEVEAVLSLGDETVEVKTVEVRVCTSFSAGLVMVSEQQVIAVLVAISWTELAGSGAVLDVLVLPVVLLVALAVKLGIVEAIAIEK